MDSQAGESGIYCRSSPHYCRSITQHHPRFPTYLSGNSLIFQVSPSWHMVCLITRASATFPHQEFHHIKGDIMAPITMYQGVSWGLFRPGRLPPLRTRIYRPRRGPENLLEFSNTWENRGSLGKCEDQDMLTSIA